MDLGNYSVGEFETKLNDALGKIMSGGEYRILDIYEGIVIFAAAGGMWGARYTVGFDGSITLGKPFRVKRICRYVPVETTEQRPIDDQEIPGDRDDQGGQLSLPEDWWKYTQDWGNDGEKVLGSTVSGDTQGRGQNEAKLHLSPRFKEITLRPGQSVEDLQRRLREAVAQRVNPTNNPQVGWPWIADVYEDRVVYSPGGPTEKYMEAPYTVAADGSISLGIAIEVQRQMSYVPMLRETSGAIVGAIVTEFVEDGALVEEGENDV